MLETEENKLFGIATPFSARIDRINSFVTDEANLATLFPDSIGWLLQMKFEDRTTIRDDYLELLGQERFNSEVNCLIEILKF